MKVKHNLLTDFAISREFSRDFHEFDQTNQLMQCNVSLKVTQSFRSIFKTEIFSIISRYFSNLRNEKALSGYQNCLNFKFMHQAKF